LIRTQMLKRSQHVCGAMEPKMRSHKNLGKKLMKLQLKWS
jgi:hypothetical protein